MATLTPNIAGYASQSTIVDLGPLAQGTAPGAVTAEALSYDGTQISIPCSFSRCWSDLNGTSWTAHWARYAWRLLLSESAAEFVSLAGRVAEMCLDIGPTSLVSQSGAGSFGSFALDSVRLGRSVASNLCCPSWNRFLKRIAGLVRGVDAAASDDAIFGIAGGLAAMAELSDGPDIVRALWGLRQGFARLLLSSVSVDPGSHVITAVLTNNAAQLLTHISPALVFELTDALPFAVAATLVEGGDGLVWDTIGNIQVLSGLMDGYNDFVSHSNQYQLHIEEIADPIAIPFESIESLGNVPSDLGYIDPYLLLGFSTTHAPFAKNAPECLQMEGDNDLARSMTLIGAISQAKKKKVTDPVAATDQYISLDNAARKGKFATITISARSGSKLLAANLAQAVPTCDKSDIDGALRRFASRLREQMLALVPEGAPSVRFEDSNVDYVIIRATWDLSFDAVFDSEAAPAYWPALLSSVWFKRRAYPVLIIPARSIDGADPKGAFASWMVWYDGAEYITSDSITDLMMTEWEHMRKALLERMEQYTQSPVETDQPDRSSYWWLLLLLIPVLVIVIALLATRKRTGAHTRGDQESRTKSNVVNL